MVSPVQSGLTPAVLASRRGQALRGRREATRRAGAGSVVTGSLRAVCKAGRAFSVPSRTGRILRDRQASREARTQSWAEEVAAAALVSAWAEGTVPV